MLCTSLWASAGMLMRFMSPSTRIIGGTPEDRCRSDALFLTANARSCAMSTAIWAPCEHVSRRRRTPRVRETCSERAQYNRASVTHMLIGPQNLPENIAARARAHRRGRRRGAGASVDSRHTPGGRPRRSPPRRCGRRAALGVRDFGESYLQEALAKIQALRDLELTWHFIGQVQANKTRSARGALRLGARRGPAAHRRAPLGTAAPSRAAAQCLHPGQRRRRGLQGRRQRPTDAAGARSSDRAAAAAALRGLMCLPPPEADAGSPAPLVRAAAASCLRSLNAQRARARYAFDGHERRTSKRPCSKARRWCASAPPCSVRARRALDALRLYNRVPHAE